MKTLKAIMLAAALAVCAAAAAQDLKPVKDRSTKKFGYQAKDKSWVILPAFDKAQKFVDGLATVTVDGLEGVINSDGTWFLKPEFSNIGKFDKQDMCEVTVKEGKTKYYGIVNRQGRMILPPDCGSISFARNDKLIMARREAPDGTGMHWGIYDYDGEQVFAPQFSSAPSFSRGMGVAKSAYTGLSGLISAGGDVLLPFEYMAISESGGTREALTTDFTVESYDQRMTKTGELRSPGAIIPYETAGDNVRIAAWHAGPIGVRLHQNNICAANLTKDASGRIAICNDLGLNWGYGRFIRLEPEIDSDGHPGSMENPVTGEMYTLRALMYEADGSFVGVVSDWGWLEGEYTGGFIYNAEGEDMWLIVGGVNARTPRQGSTVKLRSWLPVDHSNVVSGLLLGSAELNRLENLSTRASRIKDILEGENVGVNSYLPRPEPSWRVRRQIEDAMRNPIFRHSFRMEDVFNCKVSKRGDEMEIKLTDGLVCEFEDRFDSPYFRMNGKEEIYWGPRGRRTVRLALEEAEHSSSSMENDLQEGARPLQVVIMLFTEDGRYLRTLGVAPAPDFIHGGVIVFEELGIALVDRMAGPSGSVPGTLFKVPADSRLPRKLSALDIKAPRP